jgi:hypothetical protein
MHYTHMPCAHLFLAADVLAALDEPWISVNSDLHVIQLNTTKIPNGCLSFFRRAIPECWQVHHHREDKRAVRPFDSASKAENWEK